jgi:DNA polymerase III delta prime subunit
MSMWSRWMRPPPTPASTTSARSWKADDAVKYKPASARYKVYIIDEVHMLSTPAFNALLKTLEEPPPHVKFIFATTEIRKVPVTVLSRCQRFDLRRLDAGLLVRISRTSPVRKALRSTTNR